MVNEKTIREYGWKLGEFVALIGILTIFAAFIMNSLMNTPALTVPNNCSNITKGQTLWVNQSEAWQGSQVFNYTKCQNLVQNFTDLNTV